MATSLRTETSLEVGIFSWVYPKEGWLCFFRELGVKTKSLPCFLFLQTLLVIKIEIWPTTPKKGKHKNDMARCSDDYRAVHIRSRLNPNNYSQQTSNKRNLSDYSNCSYILYTNPSVFRVKGKFSSYNFSRHRLVDSFLPKLSSRIAEKTRIIFSILLHSTTQRKTSCGRFSFYGIYKYKNFMIILV
ncbi:MAG: hypothetical protein QG609_489 [Patescibacteria group bacterium]|nr:hypothetical protein [Patescibacteria group bacterium]